MALQNDTSRIQYNGNNSTTNSYAIPFVFFENAHIKCVVTTSAGVDTELTLGSGFNVTGAGNANGGSLTTTTAVPTSSKVTIFRNVPATQTTSYQEGGDFPAASHERALDKLTMIAQQTKRLADRALKVPETQNNPNDLPNASTGKKLLASDNGTLNWEENRNPPPYPATAGTQALVTAGSGASPSWQTLPSIAPGPITATGSITPRFLADRFGEVFNVADFGAVGNGIADDTAAIQAAINAAVAAGGGSIVFQSGKTYYCNTRTNPSAGQTGLGKHLHIIGSTSSLQLRFEGNGSTLYSTTFNASGTDFVYIYSRFYSIAFDGLTFKRAPHVKTSTGAPTAGVRIIPVDREPVDTIEFTNCSFIDCHNAIIVQTAPGNLQIMSGMFRKCRQFKCINCSFLYPRGGSHQSLPGDVTVSLTHWVNHAIFDQVYFDGAVGATLPSGIPFAKDGFLFPHPKHLQVTNSFFTNYQYEGFKESSTETLILTVRTNPFVQPAVGDNVTATLNDLTNSNDYLTVGKVYALYSPERWQIGIVGYYRVMSSSSPTFSPGVQVVLQRVDKTPYHGLGPELAVGQTVNEAFWTFMDVEENNSSSFYSGNTFYNTPLKQANGSLVSQAPNFYWAAPCILSSSTCFVIGNSFYGGQRSVVMEQYTFSNNKPSIISNNTFYVYTPFQEQQASPPVVAFLMQPHCRFSDNNITVQHPKDIAYALFVSNANIQITNNSMTVIEAGTVPQKTRFINFNNGGPFNNVIVEGNLLSNVDNYINAAAPQIVGPFHGSINSTVATDGTQDVTAKIRITVQSPDGAKKLLKVDNDGMIQVET